MRVASGNDKLSLDLVRSVEINYTCASDSFEGTGFVVGQVEIVCRFRRDRVSISFGALKPRSWVNLCRDHVSISPGVRWSSAQI